MEGLDSQRQAYATVNSTYVSKKIAYAAYWLQDNRKTFCFPFFILTSENWTAFAVQPLCFLGDCERAAGPRISCYIFHILFWSISCSYAWLFIGFLILPFLLSSWKSKVTEKLDLKLYLCPMAKVPTWKSVPIFIKWNNAAFNQTNFSFFLLLMLLFFPHCWKAGISQMVPMTATGVPHLSPSVHLSDVSLDFSFWLYFLLATYITDSISFQLLGIG